MHRGASWWRSNVFPCHATPCRLTHRLIEKPSLPCRFSTSLFSEENVSTKRSLTIFVTGNLFAGNLVSLIRSKDTYIPNLCSANLKETRLEESVYIATRNSKHDREETRGRLQFSNIDRKIFQMFPNNCTLRLSRAFYLLHVSACITKLKDCGAIKGGNSGCGNSGCEIGAATSASRQREGSRFERCPATQVSPAALYSVPRVQLCLWLWCCSPRDDRSTSTNRWNLPSCAHTHATDGCIIRKGMVRSWMMARIEGWPPGGSRSGERIDSVRMLGGCLTAASRTRIPLIRHIVKCNYRGGLSGPRITDPPWRFSPPYYQIARFVRFAIVSISAFSKAVPFPLLFRV